MNTVSATILIATSTALTFALLEVPITSSTVTDQRDQEGEQVERAPPCVAAPAAAERQRSKRHSPRIVRASRSCSRTSRPRPRRRRPRIRGPAPSRRSRRGLRRARRRYRCRRNRRPAPSTRVRRRPARPARRRRAAMTKAIIMPGPAFWPASAVSTKMPVPMTAPMPSMVSWIRPELPLEAFLLGGRENLVERLDALEKHSVNPLRMYVLVMVRNGVTRKAVATSRRYLNLARPGAHKRGRGGKQAPARVQDIPDVLTMHAALARASGAYANVRSRRPATAELFRRFLDSSAHDAASAPRDRPLHRLGLAGQRRRRARAADAPPQARPLAAARRSRRRRCRPRARRVARGGGGIRVARSASSSRAIFDLDRHRIPARGDEPEHWHYDVRFVVRARQRGLRRQR